MGELMDLRDIFGTMREIAEFDRENGPLSEEEQRQLELELRDLEN